MRFDKIYKNIGARGSDIEDEYDILLVNGKAIYIIEVKYKVHPTDIEKLLRKKAKNFTMLFTDYSGYEKHLGIACFQIDDEIKKMALKAGVNILQRRGKVIETIAA